ncbi:unannotated protein [freshwater metagenome]|uniref:Unannotated protein n=1 Tax=freshwater metagenome TaxID=449393 RepID=A0A6J7JD54_9ZZZZ|nr:3-alpha,7-alpha,12-alpha-trihydroxy-5-beta-cholest-24-enoyl-CoA hydratase [Actinomycetota bacterium]
MDPRKPFTAELAQSLVGASLPTSHRRWDADDVILYHLGVGAGAALPEGDLRYVYERDLVVLPSFATAVVHPTGTASDRIPGLTLDRSMTVHGEQEVILHQPIPLEADTETTGKVIEICEMGRHALIRTETQTRDADGVLLFTTRFGIVLREAGGFGVARTSAVADDAPAEPADVVVRVPTSPRQAAIYRLCGDRNPLHIDPQHARAVGFDLPILHGLSTFGAIVRCAIDEAAGGRPQDVAAIGARFGSPVIPGDELDVELWQRGEHVHIRARVPGAERAVLTHAHLQLRS